jgi:hypothetical protein
MSKALLVVDVQNWGFVGDWPVPDHEALLERIRERVTARMGAEATDQLGRLFVGTIHAYCFRMLQTYVPRYETYTPLDANQLTNFLYRQSRIIGITNLTPTDGTFKNIETFQRGNFSNIYSAKQSRNRKALI